MDKKEKIRLIENVIANISAAMISYKMYGEGHKLVQQSIDLIVKLLGEILTENGSRGITIGVIGDEVAFEKEPLYEIADRAKNFIDGIKRTGHSKITFTEGIDKYEISSLMEIFSLKEEDLKEENKLKEILKEKGIFHIAFGNIGLTLAEEEINDINKDSVIVTKNSFDLGVDFLKETIESLEKGEPLSPKSARQIVSGITGSLLKNKSLLLILTSTKSHDESTFVHDVNVCIFTVLQAEVLGIDKKYWSEIGASALLHDVGKLSVSGDILRKKGKLTKEEREKISIHPAQGAKILLETEGINILPAIVAFEHHMAYDKTGYPKRLYGKTLNLISMMVTIADYYDAVRSERSYHKGSKPEDTYEDMIKLSGKLFHPELLKNFFRIVGMYPPGTLVELNTGEIGLVLKSNPADIKRPYVEILYSHQGEKEKTPRIINLLEKKSDGEYSCTIKRSISHDEKYETPEKYK